VGYSPGYGVDVGSYGGAVMMREEDEAGVSFSVREEEEAETGEEEEKGGAKRGWSSERWDGLQMGVDMDMDCFFFQTGIRHGDDLFFRLKWIRPTSIRRIRWIFFPLRCNVRQSGNIFKFASSSKSR